MNFYLDKQLLNVFKILVIRPFNKYINIYNATFFTMRPVLLSSDPCNSIAIFIHTGYLRNSVALYYPVLSLKQFISLGFLE